MRAMISTKAAAQIEKCPVTVDREKFGWSRLDPATIGGYHESVQGNTETGRYRSIPVCVLETFAPFLPEIGESPETLQARYKEWRARLAEEIRERTSKRFTAAKEARG